MAMGHRDNKELESSYYCYIIVQQIGVMGLQARFTSAVISKNIVYCRITEAEQQKQTKTQKDTLPEVSCLVITSVI